MKNRFKFSKKLVVVLLGLAFLTSCYNFGEGGGAGFRDSYEGKYYKMTIVNQSGMSINAKADYILIGNDNSVNPYYADKILVTILPNDSNSLVWMSQVVMLVGYSYFPKDTPHNYAEFNKMFTFTVSMEGLPGDKPFVIAGWPQDQANDNSAGIYGFLYRPELKPNPSEGELAPKICSNLLPPGKAFPTDRLPGFVATVSPEGNVSLVLDQETLATLVTSL